MKPCKLVGTPHKLGLTGVVLVVLSMSGRASAAGLAEKAASPSAAVDFNAVDTDQNGRISKLEAHQVPRLEHEFLLIDTNADGWVTRDEFELFSPTAPGSGSGS